MRRVFLLKNLNFFKKVIDNRKNLWYNNRVGGGIWKTRQKGTNVALSYRQTLLRFGTALLAHTHFESSLRNCTAARSALTKQSGRGDPPNWIGEKKWGGGNSCICSNSLALEIVNPKIFNFFWELPQSRLSSSLSFWKKSPKVFFPQSCLVSVSRLDKYIIRNFDLYASLFWKKVAFIFDL